MLPPWHPHFDVWAVVVVLGVGYWYANARLRRILAPGALGPRRRQWWQWYLGLALIWLVSDWPLGDIGESQLFTVHMVEHMTLALVAPPLLLMATPRWLAEAVLKGVARWVRPVAHPVAAFSLFNVVFILIHWPDLVAVMVTNSLAHLLVHGVLFLSALLMWMPVLSPTPTIPKLRRPMQMLYLFAQSLLPTIPASFLTFSSAPLYPVYGDAAGAWGLTAVADQTIAGVVMKLGGGFIIWATIAVIWFRWTSEERHWEDLESSVSAT